MDRQQTVQVVAVVTGVVVVSTVTARLLYPGWRKRQNRALGQAYRRRCEERLDELRARLESSKIDVDRVEEITDTPLEQLINKLQAGDWKAVEVLQAYQIKALETHCSTNCLIEPILEAEQLASACDLTADKSRPLHGVPISLKENIGLKNYIESKGIGKLCKEQLSEDWYIAKVLKEQGAVPFVRTGFPQLLISFEGSNPIFGKVSHHLDASRIPGGSSAGEGALIGDGSSLLGIGTDLGGSVRVPAAFSGICGLKPSRARVGFGPLQRGYGQDVLKPVWGPMARDVHSLVTCMKATLVPSLFQIDLSIPPLPFRDEIYNSSKPLTIGYYVDDGYYPVSPACQRAVLLAKKTLEKAGHTLVAWTPPGVLYGMNSFPKCFAANGANDQRQTIKYEDIDPTLRPGMLSRLLCPRWRRWLEVKLLRLKGNHKAADLTEAYGSRMDVQAWWDFAADVDSWRRQVSLSMDSAGIDGILCPAFPIAAPKCGFSDKLLALGSYQMIYNMLDWPAGVLPVTHVTKKDVGALCNYHTDKSVEQFIKQDQTYDAVGLPVAVQCAARKWNEETVLRIMRDVEKAGITT